MITIAAIPPTLNSTEKLATLTYMLFTSKLYTAL